MNVRSVCLLLLVSLSVLAQDQDAEDVDGDVSETAESADESSGIELDDLEINTDHTEEDDEVFIPTDEVSYQQSVPFPTDI